MSNDFKLLHNGTGQTDRMPDALRDDYVLIDERSLKDFVCQMAEFARGVNYYNSRNEVDGNWCAFFEEIYDYDNKEARFSSIDDFKDKASLSPHLTLFLAFLKLFEIVQRDLNGLGKKHLDFYYRDLLRFEPCKAVPDKLALFFELNRNASNVFIPKGTEFLVGKDKEGKPYKFASKNDLVVNSAKIDKILSFKDNSEPYVFIVTSPLLKLKDGFRCFTFNTDNIKSVEYTSPEGWQAMQQQNGERWFADDNMPEFVNYNKKHHGPGIDTDYPAIRITLNRFEKNIVTNKIKVIVSGSKDFILSNKYGRLGNTNGVLPFGINPSKGDFVKIDSVSEIPVNKRSFSSFTSDIRWKDEDVLLGDYYSTYYPGTLIDNVPENVVKTIQQLPGSPVFKRNFIQYDKNFKIKDCLQNTSDYEWKLCCDLGHGIYNYLYTIILSGRVKGLDAASVPLPPVVPKIDTMTINYGYDICLQSNQCMVYQLLPTGYNIVNEHLSVFSMEQGQIIIGVKDIAEGDVLSMYLVFENTIKDADKEHVRLTYLDNENKWQQMPKENFIIDTTNSALNDGIIYLKMPDDINIESKLLSDEGEVLLRIEFDKFSDVRLRDVKTQVVESLFVPDDRGLDKCVHLNAGSQVKQGIPVTGIKKVSQLYPSYGGCEKESDEAFNVRVSERLRHKGRAWTIWDYEHLVLEKFPQVYKVKCLPCTGVDNNGNVFECPGNVMLILFPYKDKTDNLLNPQMYESDLYRIRQFISGKCSPFINVYVRNAVFEKIKIRCSVTYKHGYDEFYCNNLLNEELKTMLSPWTNNSEELNLSKAFYRSQIVYFIEKRPYIDHIDKLEVIRGSHVFSDYDKITASKIDSVLTSDESHDINNI